jgi:hypothetical protein
MAVQWKRIGSPQGTMALLWHRGAGPTNAVTAPAFYCALFTSALPLAPFDNSNGTKYSQLSDIQAYEVTGTGYTAGGVKGGATTYTANYPTSGDGYNFTAYGNDASLNATSGNDWVWTSSTITARTAVIYFKYQNAGGTLYNFLWAYATNTADVSSSNGTFRVTCPNPTIITTNL